MSGTLQRRSLPDSLRYLAEKLTEPTSDAERAGVAVALNTLADEMDPTGAPGYVACGMPSHSWTCCLHAGHEGPHEHGSADSGFYASWPNHLSAGPVRPDEETTP
jgi:hypothetical protein